VAGGIARFLHPRAKVYERVDGGIIEAEMYRPTGEAYFADYYQSYAETKFCSYADHLINQGRIDELFELAQAKITSPLSTADDINKGIFYLTRAALAECAYEPAIEMATDLIEQAISMIKDPTTSTAELKKNLMWLRIAANAGYAPAEVFLADMVSLKLQEIFCYYETTEKKEASLSFINVACEIDYHAAVELHHSTLSKEALLETAKEHLGKWDYWSEPAYFSDTLDGLFFLLDERDSAGNQDFITHKLYRRVYWSDAWFNKAKTKIENHLNDISMIQGANYLAMACWAGHEPAIAYRNKQASIWLDKAKMKIESPISNSDDRDVGRFYFELARRTHYAPAMGYLRSYADNPTMWRRLTGFNCA
jgi:hypothetical protein